MEHPSLLKNLVDHAKTSPYKKAIYVLNNNDIHQIDSHIDYISLLNCAYLLAEKIKQQTHQGDRVLLCYPTGIDFVIAFYACLIAEVIAVAVAVPSNSGLIKKFESIKNDCEPSLILTDNKTNDDCIQSTTTLQVITTDEAHTAHTSPLKNIILPQLHLDDLAFLQYTSGSTTEPKGVMISHGNLIDNITKMSRVFDGKKESIGLKWIPHTHDMGLIGSFLHSVHQGAEIYFMSPLSFIRRPLSWLVALSTYKIDMTGCPCFGLKMCLDQMNPEKINDLDLSHLRTLIVGSEPISTDVVTDFFNQLAPTGLSMKAFAPSYGLAESTLMVSSRRGLQTIEQHPTALVSCGKSYQDLQIVSLKTNRPCAEQEVGEIWLHGKSVAQGYWNNPLETQEQFQATLEDDPRAYFKTGDLGFLYQHELYLVGRHKEVIIIHGMNYYPQDIEQIVIASDPLLSKASCAVFHWPIKNSSTESFVVLIKPSKKLTEENKTSLLITIKKHILKEIQLIPHDIQWVDVNFPKTTSGKLQRTACKALYKECHAEPA